MMFKGLFGLTIGLCCFAASGVTQATEMAERLGYNEDTKLLIIHADDIGMSHSVNHASTKALETGIVTSGSIMVPCPWFPEIAAYCRANPEVDMGLHLTLTSEWKYYRWRPVASPEKVPGLIDDEGYMWHKVEQVVENATPEEVEIELRAQIERALEFGIRPTHIDSHMGTVFAKPEFLEVYIRLGLEYGLPPMLLKPTPIVKLLLKQRGVVLPDSLFERLEASGLPMLDVLVLDIFPPGVRADTYESRKAVYETVLRRLKPGVNQIIVHLGSDDPELRHITHSWRDRYNEFRIFTEPDTQKLLEELDIQLIGWREMQAQMPEKK
jgi:chitin disaccharide deacetylase